MKRSNCSNDYTVGSKYWYKNWPQFWPEIWLKIFKVYLIANQGDSDNVVPLFVNVELGGTPKSSSTKPSSHNRRVLGIILLKGCSNILYIKYIGPLLATIPEADCYPVYEEWERQEGTKEGRRHKFTKSTLRRS